MHPWLPMRGDPALFSWSEFRNKLEEISRSWVPSALTMGDLAAHEKTCQKPRKIAFDVVLYILF
jgi:hypothetical protein